MDGPKPYELIGFGAMDVTKPYEFIGFGDSRSLLEGLCSCAGNLTWLDRLHGTDKMRAFPRPSEAP